VIEHDIIANRASLTDHDTDSMIDKESATDSGSWVNLDSGATTCAIAQYSRDQLEIVAPKKMRNSIVPDCVDARIGQEDLELITSRGVTQHRVAKVFSNP